jgi:hypothetical protein
MALVLAWLLNRAGVRAPWFIESPSLAFLYGSILRVYDTWLWKWNVGPLRFSGVPRVDGLWYGYLRSSFDASVLTPAVLRVDQTWSSLCVYLETERSRSYSVAAHVRARLRQESVVEYIYHNDPFTIRGGDLASHRGTACHWAKLENLEGEYYSGRPRMNQGEMFMRRAPAGTKAVSDLKRDLLAGLLPDVAVPELGAET